MIAPRVEKALFEGVAILEDLGLRYAVVGGLAVGVWSAPRAVAASRCRQWQRSWPSSGVFLARLASKRVFLDVFDARSTR